MREAGKAGMSADEFMKRAQPILDASGSGGVPIKLIAEVAAPPYAKMGVKTGKDAKNGYATSYGRVVQAAHDDLDRQAVDDAGAKAGGHAGGRRSGVLGQSSDRGRSKRGLDDRHQNMLNYRSLQP